MERHTNSYFSSSADIYLGFVMAPDERVNAAIEVVLLLIIIGIGVGIGAWLF